MLFPLPTPLPVFTLLTTPGSELPAVCIGVSPGQAAKSVLFHTVRFGALSCWLDDSSTGEWALPLRGKDARKGDAAGEGGAVGKRQSWKGSASGKRTIGKSCRPRRGCRAGFRLQGRGGA